MDQNKYPTVCREGGFDMIDPDSTSGFHPKNSTGIIDDCIEIKQGTYVCSNCGLLLNDNAIKDRGRQCPSCKKGKMEYHSSFRRG